MKLQGFLPATPAHSDSIPVGLHTPPLTVFKAESQMKFDRPVSPMQLTNNNLRCASLIHEWQGQRLRSVDASEEGN